MSLTKEERRKKEEEAERQYEEQLTRNRQVRAPPPPVLSLSLPTVNAYLSTRPSSKSNPIRGSYGVVYRSPVDPSKVIKLLPPGTPVASEVGPSDKIADITHNEKQRVSPITITKNDVPENALKEYLHLNAYHAFMNGPIPAVEMPNLGVDLVNYLNHPTMPLTEEQFLAQCEKLLGQVQALHENKLIHSDLRAENIMFDGEEFVIVDNSLLGTEEEVEEQYRTGIHQWHIPSWAPPEFLVRFDKKDQLNRYAHTLYQRCPMYFKSKKIVESSLRECLKKRWDRPVKMFSLDFFGLGMALLEVMVTMFPVSDAMLTMRARLEKIVGFSEKKGGTRRSRTIRRHKIDSPTRRKQRR